jgi:hypothetical protein
VNARRAAIVVAAFVLAGLGAIALRVVMEGRAALADGDDWMLRGKPAEAIRSYETAARWYLPLAPHVDAAYARLRALAGDPGHAAGARTGWRTADDDATALLAWRAIRGAARATRTLWTPHAGDLADAEAAIAHASARTPGAGDAGPTTRDREAWYLAHLATTGRPRIAAAALAALGIVAWVAGALGLARRGIDEAGHLIRRPALVSAAAIVLGLAGWLVGLYNA